MPASSVSLSAAEVAEMRRLRRLAGDSDLDTVKALRATVNRLQGNLPAPGYLFLIAGRVDGLDDFDRELE